MRSSEEAMNSLVTSSYKYLRYGYHTNGQNLLSVRNINKTARCRCHYKVLGVKRTAKQHEIKSAFVKLSKRLHPDVNPDPVNHEQFVKLNEAYTVLSKPADRRQYDQELNTVSNMQNSRRSANSYKQEAPPRQQYNDYYQQEFDEERMKAEQEYWNQYIVRPKPSPIRRYRNSTVVAAIFVFAFVGNLLQFYFFRYHNRRFEERALAETRKNNIEYQAIREFALSPGFEERRMLLTQKLLEKEKINLAKYNRTLEDNELTQPSINSEVD